MIRCSFDEGANYLPEPNLRANPDVALDGRILFGIVRATTIAKGNGASGRKSLSPAPPRSSARSRRVEVDARTI